MSASSGRKKTMFYYSKVIHKNDMKLNNEDLWVCSI